MGVLLSKWTVSNNSAILQWTNVYFHAGLGDLLAKPWRNIRWTAEYVETFGNLRQNELKTCFQSGLTLHFAALM